MTTLLISKSARLFWRRKASLRDDELADWVSRAGRPGLERGNDRPRCRPASPKRRFRRKGSATEKYTNSRAAQLTRAILVQQLILVFILFSSC